MTDAAKYRAELDERQVYARRVFEAMMRGDKSACAKAQREMREKFAASTQNFPLRTA